MSNKKRALVTVLAPSGTKVQAELLEFKNVKIEPTIVEVEDGTIIKVNTLVIRVARAIDPDTNKVMITESGEPFYQVGWTTGVASETPPEVIEKFKRGEK